MAGHHDPQLSQRAFRRFRSDRRRWLDNEAGSHAVSFDSPIGSLGAFIKTHM
jgi:hypothetical protein